MEGTEKYQNVKQYLKTNSCSLRLCRLLHLNIKHQRVITFQAVEHVIMEFEHDFLELNS